MEFSFDDLELLGSTPPSGGHRRVRSDPTDIMQALRAERAEWGGPTLFSSAPKRDLSPMEYESDAPEKKRLATSHPTSYPVAPFNPPLFGSAIPQPEPQLGDPDGTGMMSLGGANDDIDATGKSKKDVPMWTVEEDLLILQLVEKHGKRWSKIALHLPGRTDNGVRNRWNRMERAQVLRQRRGPEAGYRCRRCGQPKRGHICAALTMGETPAGEELQQKAQALSKLSANRMRPPSAASEMSNAPSEPTVSAQSTPQLPPTERAISPDQFVPLPPVVAQQPAPPPTVALPPQHFLPLAPPMANLSVVRMPTASAAASEAAMRTAAAAAVAAPLFVFDDTATTARLPSVAPPATAAASAAPAEVRPSDALDEAQLDDLLEELQLHQLTSSAKAEQMALQAVAASLTGCAGAVVYDDVACSASSMDATGETVSSQMPHAMLSTAQMQQLLLSLAGPESIVCA